MNTKNLLTLLGIPALILVLVVFSVDKNFDSGKNPEEVLSSSQMNEKIKKPKPTERVDPTKSYSAIIKTTGGFIVGLHCYSVIRHRRSCMVIFARK